MVKHTSDGKLGATSDELQEVTALRRLKAAHCLQQVPDSIAVHVVTVISLDRVQKS